MRTMMLLAPLLTAALLLPWVPTAESGPPQPPLDKNGNPVPAWWQCDWYEVGETPAPNPNADPADPGGEGDDSLRIRAGSLSNTAEGDGLEPLATQSQYSVSESATVTGIYSWKVRNPGPNTQSSWRLWGSWIALGTDDRVEASAAMAARAKAKDKRLGSFDGHLFCEAAVEEEVDLGPVAVPDPIPDEPAESETKAWSKHAWCMNQGNTQHAWVSTRSEIDTSLSVCAIDASNKALFAAVNDATESFMEWLGIDGEPDVDEVWESVTDWVLGHTHAKASGQLDGRLEFEGIVSISGWVYYTRVSVQGAGGGARWGSLNPNDPDAGVLPYECPDAEVGEMPFPPGYFDDPPPGFPKFGDDIPPEYRKDDPADG